MANRRAQLEKPVGLLAELQADTAAALQRPAGWWTLILGLSWSRGAQAVALYRLGHRAWRIGLWPVAEILQRVAQVLFCVDISYKAVIGPGLVLRHAMTVVIGADVVIGSNVMIFQGVTLGKRLSGSESRPDGMPVVADGVVIGAGAAVLGPVSIGENSVIGANAVVTKDVPADNTETANHDERSWRTDEV